MNIKGRSFLTLLDYTPEEIEGLLQLIKVAHLYLYFEVHALLLEIGMAAVEGSLDATGKVNVVVLKQYHVEKSYAVVHAATNPNGLLLKDAHAGSCLTGVEHLAASALQLLHIAGSDGGYTAHALHNIEH